MGVVSAGGASNEPASGSVTVVYNNHLNSILTQVRNAVPETEVFFDTFDYVDFRIFAKLTRREPIENPSHMVSENII